MKCPWAANRPGTQKRRITGKGFYLKKPWAHSSPLWRTQIPVPVPIHGHPPIQGSDGVHLIQSDGALRYHLLPLLFFNPIL